MDKNTVGLRSQQTLRKFSFGILIERMGRCSPNLNLIERFWRFVKKQCLYSKYYPDSTAFQQAILVVHSQRTHGAPSRVESAVNVTLPNVPRRPRDWRTANNSQDVEEKSFIEGRVESRPRPAPHQIDYHQAIEERRVERARKLLDPGTILQPHRRPHRQRGDPDQHPHALVLFHLDRATAVDGGELYERCKQLVLSAIDTCLDVLLDTMED